MPIAGSLGSPISMRKLLVLIRGAELPGPTDED